MKLISIPADKYDDYKNDIIFNAYKWDPQFLDNNTVARHVLLISEEENAELISLTQELDKETILAEQMIYDNPKLAKPLKLPRRIRKHLKHIDNYQAEKHIRLSRYDFHPASNGWVVSEVNSDVPGGFAEASLMPRVAISYLSNKNLRYDDFSKALISAISKKAAPGANIMFVHCTSYSDDRQVMQFLGDKLCDMGFNSIYGASDHLIFKDNIAYSILDGNQCRVDAIVRFTPLEWLVDVKPKRWYGYFNTITTSCNHPIAVFAQTKRFPFVWDTLDKVVGGTATMFPAWRKLLPETLSVSKARGKDGFLYKPVWGRVGEKISIPEACRGDEYKKILREAWLHPNRYIAQKRFESLPVCDENGDEYHVCIGSFCVEGSTAGYYARVSKTPRIDSGAADIPVLVEG